MVKHPVLAAAAFLLAFPVCSQTTVDLNVEELKWECKYSEFDYSKNIFPVKQCYMQVPETYPDSLITEDNIVVAYPYDFNSETKKVDTLMNPLYKTLDRYKFEFNTPEEKEGEINLGRGGYFHFTKDDDGMVSVMMTGTGSLKSYILYVYEMGPDKQSQSEICVKDGHLETIVRTPKGRNPKSIGE
jgi:hypothetical protein